MSRYQLRRRDFIVLLGGATAVRPRAAHAQAWPSQVVRIICIATFPHATNRYLYSSLGYDPVADFAPVTLIGLYPLMMVVPNSSPAHSVKEFIAYAKVKMLSYASSGHGTSLHLAGELFKRKAGIEMTHVPNRGAGPAFNDLIPGRIDAMIN